jgi:hypothetical protein
MEGTNKAVIEKWLFLFQRATGTSWKSRRLGAVIQSASRRRRSFLLFFLFFGFFQRW